MVHSSVTLAPSLLDRLLDDDPRTTSPLFSVFDLLNPMALGLVLRDAHEPISLHIRQHLTPDALSALDAVDGSQPMPGLLQEGMVEALNRLVDGDCVFEHERFQGVTVAEETIRLLEEKPTGRSLMFLNRSLLEDAYPQYLRTRRVLEMPYTLSELKRSVSRDIEALLNSRQEVLKALPHRYNELQGSLLFYGLPDFTAMSLRNDKDRKAMRRAIEQTIAHFEPRLKAVTVEVLAPSQFEQVLPFRIEALLQVEPEPESVMFDAVLQLATAKYDVKSQ